MHEICQIAFEAHHAACKQSSGSKLGQTPQSKTIRDEEAFFLLKIIGMKEKNTEAYSAKNGPEKRRVRILSRVGRGYAIMALGLGSEHVRGTR